MKALFFLSIILTITACGGSSKVESDQSMEDENVIAYDVEIRTTQTSEYCGGSRPSEEMMNELETPQPLANTTIYLREGEVNSLSLPIAYSLKSDESGLIHAKIKKGTYSVVFEHKKDQATYDTWLENYGQATAQYSAIDTNCFNTFFQRPDQVIQVGKSETDSLTNQFAVNTINRCERTRVPCASYKGPVRPSATPQE
jgi:hypothetical protein